LFKEPASEATSLNRFQHLFDVVQVYDAINENPDAPNLTWPDETNDKAIIEFHACESMY
jgi:hypothetical protein